MSRRDAGADLADRLLPAQAAEMSRELRGFEPLTPAHSRVDAGAASKASYCGGRATG
jgi:hypothetical protein